MQNVALINTWQMQLYSLTPWFLHPFTVATWHPPKSHNGINRSERVNPPNCRIFGGVSSLTKTSRNTLRRLWAIVDRSPARRVQSKWFRKERDPVTAQLMYRYTQEYWQCKRNQDWSRCPDIFLWRHAVLFPLSVARCDDIRAFPFPHLPATTCLWLENRVDDWTPQHPL